MMKYWLIVLLSISPFLLICQNVEVEGEIVVDSLNLNSGLVRNVANPILAQDAATKAYVDMLLSEIEIL